MSQKVTMRRLATTLSVALFGFAAMFVVGDSLNVSSLKTQTLDASQESPRSELTSFIKEEAIESKDVADSNIQAEVLKIVLKALVSFY
jgi:hypothetical protein